MQSTDILEHQPRHPSIDSLQPVKDADIFRGDPPQRSTSPVSITFSSSSSSASSRIGGRFTAIAAAVELAISRWARSSDTSSNSSDSSSRSSSVASHPRTIVRRRRRPAATDPHSLQSERELAAKFRARQQARLVPREFVLYLPPALRARRTTGTRASADRECNAPPPQCVSRTASLSLILGQLDTALRRSKKPRGSRSRGRTMSTEQYNPGSSAPAPAPQHLNYMMPEPMLAPIRPASPIDLAALRLTMKGKERETTLRHPAPISKGEAPAPGIRAPKAWWLDVSSPTWEDMRALGKLLHLHPLTLEDILQQEPHEKLELFPRLGYYFVSFRAIGTQATRERFRHDAGQNQYRNDGGAVDEVNIYLVVFREGVCSFHFEDIAEHTDRVRNRVTRLEETVNMSSDWIAHGILDSVVDSFFPFVEEIEKEVQEMEGIVFSTDPHMNQPSDVQPMPSKASRPPDLGEVEPKAHAVEVEKATADNKSISPASVETCLSSARSTAILIVRPLQRAVRSLSIWISRSRTGAGYQTLTNPTSATLRRMVRTRRLVTSLTRLLVTKSKVVAQIRKRLLTAGQSGLGNGAGKDDDMEVAIHMGDVQDHILTLQQSLTHYEHMLSQSYPNYLTQLRVSAFAIQSRQDKAIMLLTVTNFAEVLGQTVIGVFSLNVRLPKNSPGVYNLFGMVIALILAMAGIYLLQVRRWWMEAQRKRGARQR